MKIKILILLVLSFSSLAIAREHPYFVNGVSASPDGKYVAIGRLDRKLVLYDLEAKKELRVITEKEGYANTQTFFTQDGKTWVYQDISRDLVFWNIANQKEERRVALDDGATALCIFKDNQRLIWGANSGKIEFVDLKTNEGRILKKPNPYGGFEKPIGDIILSPDESRFVSVTEIRPDDDILVEPAGDFGPTWDGKDIIVKHIGINLWDAQTFTKIKKLQAKDTSGKAWATFSPDSKYVFTSYENGRLHQWNAENGELVRTYDWSEGQGKNVSYLDSSGRRVGTTEPSVNELTVIDPINRVHFITQKFNHQIVAFQMVTVPSKNLIITGDTDGSISVYKFNPEKLDIELIWHPEPVKSGIITWGSPLKMMYKSEAEARKMQQDYIEQQKKMGYGDEENPPNGKTAPASSDGSKDSGYPGVSLGPGVNLK